MRSWTTEVAKDRERLESLSWSKRAWLVAWCLLPFALFCDTLSTTPLAGFASPRGGLVKAKVHLDVTYIPSEDVISRDIEGELIIVPLTSGVGGTEDEGTPSLPSTRPVGPSGSGWTANAA
jgi:hypothetical protein